MMTQRRRRRAPATADATGTTTTSHDRPELRSDLFAQIAAGARRFEIGNRDSAARVDAFQDHVRALESLASDGLIAIGARETTTDDPRRILAIRRIRLTEAGKRHVAASASSTTR